MEYICKRPDSGRRLDPWMNSKENKVAGADNSRSPEVRVHLGPKRFC